MNCVRSFIEITPSLWTLNDHLSSVQLIEGKSTLKTKNLKENSSK